MADQLDDRPVFTIVMGCNGAGKSAWKRENYERLPRRYFDQDSIAGGIGDWNSEEARARTREYVDKAVAEAIADRVDFGVESTYSGRPGPRMVERALRAGYRIEGVYIGTDSADINRERIEHRVRTKTGHRVDVVRLPERYRWSLSNLRKTAEQFDELEIVDNSAHDKGRRPWPVEQVRLEKGTVTERAEELRPWCTTWLARLDESRTDERTRPARPGGEPPSGERGGQAGSPADGRRAPTGGGAQDAEADHKGGRLEHMTGATEHRKAEDRSSDTGKSGYRPPRKHDYHDVAPPPPPPRPPSVQEGPHQAASRDQDKGRGTR